MKTAYLIPLALAIGYFLGSLYQVEPAEPRFRVTLYNTSLYKGVNTYSGWIETKRGDYWYGLQHVEWDEQLFKPEHRLGCGKEEDIYIGAASAYETTTGGGMKELEHNWCNSSIPHTIDECCEIRAKELEQ